jgi:hypothetical protein
VELQPIDVSDAGEIERALADFAHAPNGSLIVPLSVFDRPPCTDCRRSILAVWMRLSAA